MRALRTYINGMHRIADDLELAYTLLVASVESLAQEFDGHESNWESLDEHKRKAIDEALSGADEMIAQRVRGALLSVEHVALSRRFREFVLSHMTSGYFRNTPDFKGPKLGRSDLPEVLGKAYQSRSKYIHQLLQLPDMVTMGHEYSETAIAGRSTFLTLQGLSRLMRHTIIEFVMNQPSVANEPYNYHLERSGVVKVRLAPQYWVGRAEGDITEAGRDKLEGFLEQLAPCLLKEKNAVLTDIRPVLTTATAFIPHLNKRLRLPYLALFALFNMHVPAKDSFATPAVVEKLIQDELGEPSSEALISYALSGNVIPWSLEVHRTALRTYLRRRTTKNGLRFPRLFEAAITLELAERLRCNGEVEDSREFVSLAVENYPGHSGLLQFEEKFQTSISINWRDVMMPPKQE